MKTLIRALCGTALIWLAPLAASAADYFRWEAVELPASSGASCGNGTPYRFFVNRTPLSKDLVLVYEGGGACWDQNACSGIGPLSAANPDGVPADYLQQLNSAAYGLVTPFSSRNDPFQAVQTQSWNIVYLPYCTGDVHAGSKTRTYSDANPSSPRVQHFRGQANIRAASQWLRDTLGKPKNLMLTGFSAGGVGSTVTYELVRGTLQATGKVSLLADSGPLMMAPSGGTPAQYPSLPMHTKIRGEWGLDEPGGLIANYAGSLPAFNPDNLGTVTGALAQKYPLDRFGYMVFQADANFSAFSYEKFYPDIANAPNALARRQALYARWEPDLAAWIAANQGFANVAYHVPFMRQFNESHCVTIVDFSGTGIEDAGIASVGSFVDAVLDRGPVMRSVEVDREHDKTQELSPAIKLFRLLMNLL